MLPASALMALRRDADRARLKEADSMKAQITGLRVASVVFGLMALGQLVRLIIRPEVLVAGHLMPLWSSALAFVILGGLSLWMWKLARRPTNCAAAVQALLLIIPLPKCRMIRHNSRNENDNRWLHQEAWLDSA